MKVYIKTFDFGLIVNSKTLNSLNDFENYKHRNRAIYDGGKNAFELNSNLSRIVFQQTGCSTNFLYSEHAR